MKQNNKLNGIDAINRAKALMSESTKIDKPTLNNNFKLIKEGADNKYYAIVKEASKYVVKKGNDNTEKSFDYLLGKAKKHSVMFESYSQAAKFLNNILFGLNESTGKFKDVDALKNDITLKEEEVEDEELVDGIEIEESFDLNLDEMVSEIDPIDELEENFIQELDEMTDFLDEVLNEKYVLKVDSPKMEDNSNDFDMSDFGDDEESGDDFDMSDFDGDDDSNTGDENTGEENPFGEPFDAGVEADEDEDPKTFLQQLAGKLATSLRTYEKENSDDVDTKKFVANSILSAIDTEGMDPSDINDIKKKLDEPSTENSDETDNTETEESSDDLDDFDMDDSENEDDEQLDENHEDEFILSKDNAYRKKNGIKEPESEISKKRKNMDPNKPLNDPQNKIHENFNQNIDEYLSSMLNPSIFAQEEKKNEMVETKPEVKPEVRPSTTPIETPSRRRAPFKNPGIKPQPKLKK